MTVLYLGVRGNLKLLLGVPHCLGFLPIFFFVVVVVLFFNNFPIYVVDTPF
jgi:hypothetical protein